MTAILEVVEVSKAYTSASSSPWERLASAFRSSRARSAHAKWVLRDVSFHASPGESLAILGMNGAGKSTLLKIVVGTTKPTRGHVQIRGRIAPLLELGIGFHPDFTGRENVLMAGQLLGHSADALREALPDIEAFAEIGSAIDDPIRSYSSGMQMRLAFSVATVFRPDVLIVDEALSVGDAYFQAKCFDRIRQHRAQGTTLLFVSHDPVAISSLCDRAILLDSGQVAATGDPETVLNFYNASLARRTDDYLLKQHRDSSGNMITTSGTGDIVCHTLQLGSEDGSSIAVFRVGQVARLKIEFESRVEVRDLVVGFAIKDRLGRDVFGTNTHYLRCEVTARSGDRRVVEFRFPLNIGAGEYSVSIAFHTGASHIERNLLWLDGGCRFEVVNLGHTEFIGMSYLPVSFDGGTND